MKKGIIIGVLIVLIVLSLVLFSGNVRESPDFKENNWWRDSEGNWCEPLSQRADLNGEDDEVAGGRGGTCKCKSDGTCCTCAGGGNCACSGHNTDCACSMEDISISELKAIY